MDTVRPRRHRSIARRIALQLVAIGALFTLANVAIIVAMYYFDEDALAYDLVSIVAEDAIEDLSSGSIDDPAESLPAAIGIAIFDQSGALIHEANPSGLRLNRIEADLGRRSETGWSRRNDRYFISGLRQGVLDGRPVTLSIAITGQGLMPYLPAMAREVWQHALLPLVPLTLLLVAFSVGVVTLTLSPLGKAARDADELGPETIGRRLSIEGAPDEIQSLVDAVNRVLNRLESAMATLREFSADAAHELRTPLSVMRLHIDQMPSGPLKARIVADVEAMTRLVNQMLDMAQTSSLALRNGEMANLSVIARDTVVQLTPLAISRGRTIRFHDFAGENIVGNSDAIGRAVRNIIENALGYAPEGTAVDVTVGPAPTIEVRDVGPGIPLDTRQKVLQRYWRKDRSGSGSAGLGMAIVNSVMTAHGGSIEIADAVGGGAMVRLHFGLPRRRAQTAIPATLC